MQAGPRSETGLSCRRRREAARSREHVGPTYKHPTAGEKQSDGEALSLEMFGEGLSLEMFREAAAGHQG